MESFFDMGGYAAFVWPAFGLSFIVMAGMVVATLRPLWRRQRELEQLEASGARRVRGSRETVRTEQRGAEA